jgi:hypothetical protein
MIAKDTTLGKNGLGVLFVGLCPLILLGVGVELFLSIDKFDGQDGGAVSLVYGVLSLACLIYAVYIAYCLSFSVKTARIVEYSSHQLRITDYLGRTFFYTIESMDSCELTRLNFLLRCFFLFRSDKPNDSEVLNRLVKFQDGRSFILSPRIQGIEAILEAIHTDRLARFPIQSGHSE